MSKVQLDPNAFIYPMPVTLVGATVAGRVNFLAVAWVTRVNLNPPLLAVAINRRHFTPPGIREHGNFSVNCPSADMLEQTDYCGLVSGRQADKSGLFEVFYGKLKTAPMIRECPLCLECSLNQVVELPSQYLFIGEIVAAYTEEHYLTDGKPDIHKMNPLVLTMPDNNYWTVGEHAGRAWSAGKKLRAAQKA